MRRIHTIWGSIIFLALFAILFPVFMVLLIHKRWKKYSYLLNNFWAFAFFNLSSIPYKINYLFRPDKKKQYIFCANHFSVIDIPTMGLVARQPFAFVGKSSITKQPIFGFMYQKFHITVNRESLKDRYNSVIRSMQAIDEGFSLVIFPEGGVKSKNPPILSSFKDGAFRIAIEKQIPIIPVTLGNNWEVLRDDGKVLLKRKINNITIHQPIETLGLTMGDLDDLKARTASIIDNELKRICNPQQELSPYSKSDSPISQKI